MRKKITPACNVSAIDLISCTRALSARDAVRALDKYVCPAAGQVPIYRTLAEIGLSDGMEGSTERRQKRRHKTLKGGLILYGVAPAVPCVIRNLSEVGARLELDDIGLIPDQFAVLIKPEDIKRNCQAIWRADRRIGVQFI